MVGVLPMKRIVLNAVFATLAVAVGCIIGWAFSVGANAGLGRFFIALLNEIIDSFFTQCIECK